MNSVSGYSHRMRGAFYVGMSTLVGGCVSALNAVIIDKSSSDNSRFWVITGLGALYATVTAFAIWQIKRSSCTKRAWKACCRYDDSAIRDKESAPTWKSCKCQTGKKFVERFVAIGGSALTNNVLSHELESAVMAVEASGVAILTAAGGVALEVLLEKFCFKGRCQEEAPYVGFRGGGREQYCFWVYANGFMLRYETDDEDAPPEPRMDLEHVKVEYEHEIRKLPLDHFKTKPLSPYSIIYEQEFFRLINRGEIHQKRPSSKEKEAVAIDDLKAALIP